MYNKKPVDHLEGKWERGKRYSLHAIVENNGSFFRSLTGKPKAEPYVISQGDTFVANEGWAIVYMSEDSRVSSKNALGRLAILEDIMGITLDPNIDERRNQPLTFRAGESNVTLRLMKESEMGSRTIEYSLDGGFSWLSIEFSDETVETTNVISISSGGTALLRGNNSSYSIDSGLGFSRGCYFTMDATCYVSGNIMSLVDSKSFPRKDRVEAGAFYSLFNDCSLMEFDDAPLLLPATKLSKYCYFGMFSGCTGLTSAPELPATTLADGCYSMMFNGCTGLTSAPELPATTLANSCYNNMFNGCTGLTSAPELPATTLANGCYTSMFSRCTGLTVAPELPATTLVNSCYGSMFNGCSNLAYIKAMFTTTPGNPYTLSWVTGVKASGTFVKNAAATWNVNGSKGVPSGWTVETAVS